MKMLTYLFCQLIDLFESQESANADLLMAAPKGRGAKKSGTASVSKESAKWAWDAELKRSAVIVFYRLINLNLPSLFEPPIVEEDFINMIACSLFRLLESPSIAHVKNKDLKVSVLQVCL